MPAVRPAPNHDTWLDRRHAELTRFMQTSVLTGCKIPGSGYDSVSIEGKLVTIVTRLAAHKELQFRRAMVLQKHFCTRRRTCKGSVASWQLGPAVNLVKNSVSDGQSLHLIQQLPRFTQQPLNPPSLGDRIFGEQAVRARVLVCLWRAGTSCTTVHAAALLAVHRRRAACAAGTGFGATPRAR